MVSARGDLGLRILRIYSSAIERKDYPGPREFSRFKLDTICPEEARPYALHHLIRKSDCGAKLAKLEEELQHMRRRNKLASGKWCSKYRKELRDACVEFLKKEKFDVVFCTCNEAAGARVREYLSPHQCIIDECGMAYEPETIVPIGLCEHVVLIGDHKQLPPVIDYQPAKKSGLTVSLFERYAQYYKDEDYIFTLKIQYRMVRHKMQRTTFNLRATYILIQHKEICSFPSQEFYNDELITDRSVLNRPDQENLRTFWPRGNPIMFCECGRGGRPEQGRQHQWASQGRRGLKVQPA